MLAALLAGERDPRCRPSWHAAGCGPSVASWRGLHQGFTDHHGFPLAQMLGRVDGLDADIAELDHQLEELIIPFTAAADRLDASTGVGRTAACAILAEVGWTWSFPHPGHLASWARFAPGVKQSAGKTKAKRSTGHGNP